MTMHACATFLALASPALAFRPSARPGRPAVALGNTLRDMAAYPDSPQFAAEFEAFDPAGAFSRSPQAQGGGGYAPSGDRAYTQDGFDPYAAYGGRFGTSASDHRRGAGGPRGMDHYGYGPPGPGMMGANGVHNDNTLEGFAYSSRVREQGRVREQQQQQQQQGRMEGPYGGGPPPPFYDQGPGGPMDGGFDPRFAGDPMMGGGMDFEPLGGGFPEGPGGFGGFDGGDMDLSRMGP